MEIDIKTYMAELQRAQELAEKARLSQSIANFYGCDFRSPEPELPLLLLLEDVK